MECKQCHKTFDSKRKTAIFCSPKCRNLAFRKVSVADSVAPVSVAVSVAGFDKPLEGDPDWGPAWLTWEGYALRLSAWTGISLEEARQLVKG